MIAERAARRDLQYRRPRNAPTSTSSRHLRARSTSSRADAAAHARPLITFVADRPGHDLRYAIDARKIRSELGWRRRKPSKAGSRKTVQWYLAEPDWWERIRSGVCRGERLGAALKTSRPYRIARETA